MVLQHQVQEIAKYFKQYEKNQMDFKIGVEFEYFIVDKDNLQTVSYYGPNGVKEILEKLLLQGWEGNYEDHHLLGLNKNDLCITLEPGCQLEISIFPKKEINEIKESFFAFLADIIPILEFQNQMLVACGYQPHSRIHDITMIPKKRYTFMYDYFKKCGSFAHHMMKGTASVQISIDYQNEADYIRKFKIANALSPVFYAIFDNSPYFEGDLNTIPSLRTHIWNHCDDNRCGIVSHTFEPDFGYAKYAQYVLERTPIFLPDGAGIKAMQNPYHLIFNPEHYEMGELEHVLTMFFPDVRTKKYIEIRMIDALPYPFNIGVVALIKGLFYDESNLTKMHYFFETITYQEVLHAKELIVKHGVDTIYNGLKINEIMLWLINLAIQGLNEEDQSYLKPIEEMVKNRKTPSHLTKDLFHKTKIEQFDWCVIKRVESGDQDDK